MSVGGRNVLHLRPPPPPAHATDPFPAFTLLAGTRLYRSHNGGYAPWWFGSTGQSRFDLAPPLGTCYVAESAAVALRETWGDLQRVPAHLAETRMIAALRTRSARRLADLTDDLASNFGITSEIFTTERYDLCQAWAAYFQAAGHEGLRYWARHDLSHRETAVALFDAAGDRTAAGGLYVVETDELVMSVPQLMDEMRARYGVLVLPT